MCDDDNLLQVKIDIIEKLDKMIDGLADKSDGFVSPQIAIFLGFVSIVLSVFNLKNQSLSAVNLAVFVMSLTVFLAVFAIMTLFIRYTKIIRTKINVIKNTRDQIVELKTKQEIYTHYAAFLSKYRHPVFDMPRTICQMICNCHCNSPGGLQDR